MNPLPHFHPFGFLFFVFSCPHLELDYSIILQLRFEIRSQHKKVSLWPNPIYFSIKAMLCQALFNRGKSINGSQFWRERVLVPGGNLSFIAEQRHNTMDLLT